MTAKHTAKSKAAIQRGDTIPDFTLPDTAGEAVSSRRYYIHRNLVIALLPAHLDAAWRGWLGRLAQARTQVDPADAQFLVIARTSNGHIDEFARESASHSLRVLIDGDGSIAGRFGHDASEGQLIVTDRYGVVFQSAWGYANAEAVQPAEIPGWVEFIACRCS